MPAQPKSTLLIIRHGETVWNAEHRFQGHGDSLLTETGRNQVAALGRRMEGFNFDALISQRFGTNPGNRIDYCWIYRPCGGV